MTMTTALKARESRLRRKASRRGLRIAHHRGDPSWGDLGAYVIMEDEKVVHVIHQVVPERKVTAADWSDMLDQVEGLVLIAGRREPSTSAQ
jgi:hypothetical protein